MRIANVSGRLGLLTQEGLVDVESASDGKFAADPQEIYDRWDEFLTWARTASTRASQPYDADALEAPTPRPRQVFAIGLNYREHAVESGMELPTTSLVVFTKFPSSITGPFAAINLPDGSVDYEAELVAVLGRYTYRVSEAQAWDHVAGLTMGQDLSERELQLKPPVPQFNLGKSFPGFAPMGPELVTPDEFDDPNDLELVC